MIEIINNISDLEISMKTNYCSFDDKNMFHLLVLIDRARKNYDC